VICKCIWLQSLSIQALSLNSLWSFMPVQPCPNLFLPLH
jgi:hypothetical protein